MADRLLHPNNLPGNRSGKKCRGFGESTDIDREAFGIMSCSKESTYRSISRDYAKPGVCSVGSASCLLSSKGLWADEDCYQFRERKFWKGMKNYGQHVCYREGVKGS